MKVGSGCGEFCHRGESANLNSDVILVKKKKKGDDGQSGIGSKAVSLSIKNWPLTPGSSQVFPGSRAQS